MGVEYKIRFKHQEKQDVDSLLRALPHFAEFDAEWKMYNYRLPDNPGQMPNVAMQIEDDGLYFCDYLMPPDMLNQVAEIIRQKYGEAEVEKYEP